MRDQGVRSREGRMFGDAVSEMDMYMPKAWVHERRSMIGTVPVVYLCVHVVIVTNEISSTLTYVNPNRCIIKNRNVHYVNNSI